MPTANYWVVMFDRDGGEKDPEAISFVESVMDSWVDAELEFKAEEKADD
jgi:hypothetical protein